MKHIALKNPLGRREFLIRAAFAGMAMALPHGLAAQDSLVTTPLRNNIHLITGAGCNVIVATGSAAVVVVDGGLPESSGALLAEINRLGAGKPVQALFNSNWRPLHCGLNHELGPQGTAIIAHENTRLWQNNDFYVDWEDRHYQPMPVAAQANETFYKTGSQTLDDETIEYGLLGQCRTDGDIYVRFVNANLLVTGDMMTVGTYPLMDYVTGGWINGARDATTGLLALADADTLIVPAAGPVQRRAVLETQQQMLDHAFEEVAQAYRNGRSLEEFMAAMPMADFDPVYGDSALFVELLYRGAWYHVTGRAIRGII